MSPYRQMTFREKGALMRQLNRSADHESAAVFLTVVCVGLGVLAATGTALDFAGPAR